MQFSINTTYALIKANGLRLIVGIREPPNFQLLAEVNWL